MSELKELGRHVIEKAKGLTSKATGAPKKAKFESQPSK
jgi:hypothetical protein